MIFYFFLLFNSNIFYSTATFDNFPTHNDANSIEEKVSIELLLNLYEEYVSNTVMVIEKKIEFLKNFVGEKQSLCTGKW